MDGRAVFVLLIFALVEASRAEIFKGRRTASPSSSFRQRTFHHNANDLVTHCRFDVSLHTWPPHGSGSANDVHQIAFHAKATSLQGDYKNTDLSMYIWLRAMPRRRYASNPGDKAQGKDRNSSDGPSRLGPHQGDGSNGTEAQQPSSQGKTFDIKGFAFMVDDMMSYRRTPEELTEFLNLWRTSHILQPGMRLLSAPY